MFRLVLFSLLSVLLQLMPPPVLGQQTLSGPPADAPPTDRIMVKWRESGIAAVQIGTLRARAARLEQATGIPLRAVRSMGAHLDVIRIMRTGLPGQMQQTLARLTADPSVEYAEPDERVYALGSANDPRFVAGSDLNGQWLGQWYLQPPDATTPAAINATGAWDSSRANGIRIAVIDSGIRADHPDLAGKLLPGRDFVCNDNLELGCTDGGATLFLTAGDGSGWDADPADPGDGLTAADLQLDIFRANQCGDGTNHDQPIDSSWHGTRVAGLIAAITNNGVGIASVAPDAYIIPVRALGKCVGYTSDLVAAMLWAGGISDTALSNAAIAPLTNISRAHVLNLSLGNRSSCSITEQAAIDKIVAAGAVVVAAAGNDGGPVGAPANCQGVLAVSGVRHAGTKVGYSNVSSATAAIGIAAPAGNCVNVVTTLPCVYAIDTLTNEGKLAPLASSGLTAYTYALLNPGYAGSRFNYGNVGTSFAAPLVSGVIALMYSVNGYLLPAEFIQRIEKSARPFPVPATAPSGGICHVATGLGDVQDRECSCTTATCGAGLLDAAAAVNEALRPIALIKSSVTAASIGQRVSLDGSTSLAAGGGSIAAYRWSAEPNVSIAGAGTAQAEFIFPATRPVTLTLVVTDSAGRQDTTTASVDPLLLGSSAGGGGALGLADLGALAALLAMVWLRLSSKCAIPAGTDSRPKCRYAMQLASRAPLGVHRSTRLSPTLLVRRPGVRGFCCLSLLAMLLTVAGCGSGSNTGTGVNSNVGTSSGVSITSSTGGTSLLAGETLALTAAVTNDTNNAGVSWVLDGDGALSDVTTSTATYHAPASVAGTSTPIITATSIASSAQLAAATLIVSGTPVIDAAPLFPANVGVPYAASVIANGGKSPYVWELTAGALPDGMTKAGNTLFYESLSGTPTVTGSFPISLKVTDANGATSSADLTLVVNAASSCLISGRYALVANGIAGGTSPITRAAALSIDGAGAITGIGDRKTNSATNVGESLTGTCTIRVANSGELQLKMTSESPNFNYSAVGSLAEARLQLTNGGDSTAATGHLYLQTPAAFSLASIAGNYAFGTLGAESGDRRVGLVGQFSVSASGVVSAGRVDSNGASPITAAPVTGTMSAPDVNGRGTLTLAGSGVNYSFAYYVLNTGKLLLINVDSATTASRLTGFATRRVASFTAGALTGNSVFSLWGWAGGLAQPRAVVSLGRLSGGNAQSGAISLLIDSAVRDVQLASVDATATSYAVEADGRVTLNATISGTARSFTLYLDAANDGYLIERNASTGNAGLLEAQMDGPFNRTLPGIWVAGTQFPQSSAPIALLPATYISNGSLSASSSSGFVAISPVTGRGLGTISTSGLSQANMAFYVVQPNRALLLRFGNPNLNGSIDWYVN